MTESVYRFEVSKAHLDGFVGALVLGTLEAMRAGFWPLDAGIWSLGRPVFRGPLERAGVDAQVVEVLREVDELSALEELAGRAAAEASLDEMIAVLRAQLGGATTQPWCAIVRE